MKNNGESEVWEFLETLRVKESTNKDARIQYKQAVRYTQLLQDNVTRLPEENVTRMSPKVIEKYYNDNPKMDYFYSEEERKRFSEKFR